MSASLSKRVATLEAQVPGAVVPSAFVWRPYAMMPEEEATFEAGLAERRKANPRQQLVIVGWGEPDEEAA
jgi:hypothetical protein